MLIEANGIKMNYELSGREGAPVVMLSHSLGSSLFMWNPQLRVLEPHYQVLRYDTRGHGGSDAPSGAYTLDMLGEDALGLLDALGIEKVHFVGLPQDVDKLVHDGCGDCSGQSFCGFQSGKIHACDIVVGDVGLSVLLSNLTHRTHAFATQSGLSRNRFAESEDNVQVLFRLIR